MVGFTNEDNTPDDAVVNFIFNLDWISGSWIAFRGTGWQDICAEEG